MQKITKINAQSITVEKEIDLTRKINDFVTFKTMIEPVLQKIKIDLTKYLIVKQKEIVDYRDVPAIFERYEELNANFYADNHWTELVFKNPKTHLLDLMRESTHKLRNPYIDVYHWVKGELYDLNSMTDVLNLRDAMIKGIRKPDAKADDVKEVTH
jgi:hypothetical protein